MPARAAIQPPAALRPPRLTADAAILLDAATGDVLWARDAGTARAPASTTKIMTALLALELGSLDDLVTVSRRAAGTPGSSSHLRAGERIPLGELLKGLLLRSGNDAAVAIAEHLAGSTSAFADLMNARASQLGLRATHFTNPHGLTQPGHYASAYDLALLARAAMAYPAFAAIVRTPVGEMAGLSPGDRSFVRRLHNTNRLLLAYDWVDGVKTGTTAAAGSCLVASGNRNGRRLIAVVLHSDNRWRDAVRLLEYGYAAFDFVPVAVAGEVQRTVRVRGGRERYLGLAAARTLTVPVPVGAAPQLVVRTAVAEPVRAPVAAEARLGTLTVALGGRTLGTVALVAARAVARAAWWQMLLRWLGL